MKIYLIYFIREMYQKSKEGIFSNQYLKTETEYIDA